MNRLCIYWNADAVYTALACFVLLAAVVWATRWAIRRWA